jgi:hypothetical protein
MTKIPSSFLFPIPSFWEGVARVADFGFKLNQFNGSSTPEAADLRALRADFRIVGEELWDVWRSETSNVKKQLEESSAK